MQIGQYTISNTSGNKKFPDVIRIYRTGELIISIYPPRRNPLQYIQSHPRGKYSLDMRKALLAENVPKDIIKFILGEKHVNLYPID